MTIGHMDHDGVVTIHVAPISSLSSLPPSRALSSSPSDKYVLHMNNDSPSNSASASASVSAASTTVNGSLSHEQSHTITHTSSTTMHNRPPTATGHRMSALGLSSHASSTTLSAAAAAAAAAAHADMGFDAPMLEPMRCASPSSIPPTIGPLTVMVTPPTPMAGEERQPPYYPTLTVTVHDVDSGMKITNTPPIVNGSDDDTLPVEQLVAAIGGTPVEGAAITGPFATHPNHHHYYHGSSALPPQTVAAAAASAAAGTILDVNGVRQVDSFAKFRMIFDEARTVVIGKRPRYITLSFQLM